eukprot:COSAG01_NODE_369_length_18046_cov_130.301443_5_plen_236_part_00
MLLARKVWRATGGVVPPGAWCCARSSTTVLCLRGMKTFQIRHDDGDDGGGGDAEETRRRGLRLLGGGELPPDAFLAYETYGTLNGDASNAILWVTCYGERHTDPSMAALLEPGPMQRFDTSRYFVVTVNMLGNGLSYSPTTPGSGAAWPHRGGGVRYHDNARAQRQLLRSLGVERLALIYGFSMGAMLALEYAVQFPAAVSAVVAVCGSAQTGPANRYFLDSLQVSGRLPAPVPV